MFILRRKKEKPLLGLLYYLWEIKFSILILNITSLDDNINVRDAWLSSSKNINGGSPGSEESTRIVPIGLGFATSQTIHPPKTIPIINAITINSNNI